MVTRTAEAHRVFSFSRGGFHPPDDWKETKDSPIEKMPPPPEVTIPLSQHLGAPNEPAVKKGETVKIGQVVGRSAKLVSAPVHATVSGKVKAVEHRPHPMGARVLSVVIESDGQEDWIEGIDPSNEEIEIDFSNREGWLERIREAGVVGMGGAGFPTHVKLSPPPDKPIDTVIFNGAECEPYLTSDHRVMLEHPRDMIQGCRIIQAILGAGRGIIAVEDNKPDAVETLREASGETGLEVVVCETKYPQGGEKQLIKAILDREVPSRGLPLDVGVVVDNVATCMAVYQAVARRRPLIERVVTVSGPGVSNKKNLLVRIGTLFQAVLDYCGAKPQKGDMVVMGGPMMGRAVARADVPVVKVTGGILVWPRGTIRNYKEGACLRCGDCVEVCPMGLLPGDLASLARAGRLEELAELGIHDCIECGCCTYACPANRDIVHWIRLGKFEEGSRKK